LISVMSGKNQNIQKISGYLLCCRDFFIHYAGGLYHRIGEHHVFLLSGGLAFSLFVCIVPFVFISFAVLGMVLEKPAISDQINIFIDGIIPYQHEADFVKKLVFSRVDEFKIYKNIAGWIGLIGLLFASSGLFSSMRTILNLVYKMKPKGTFLHGKLRDLGLVFLVLLYFLLSITILPGFEIIKEFAEKSEIFQIMQFDFIEGSATGLVSFLMIFISFLTIYFYIPMGKMPKRAIVVSALSSAVLWELAKQLFGFYITNFITINRIYGAYALIIILAFWVYYSSVVFIMGAEIGQLYRERIGKLTSITKQGKMDSIDIDNV